MALTFEEACKILEVAPEASGTEVKTAYRKLAMKWHPDKHEGPEKENATRRFQQVSNAYQKLTTPEEDSIEIGDFQDAFQYFMRIFMAHCQDECFFDDDGDYDDEDLPYTSEEYYDTSEYSDDECPLDYQYLRDEKPPGFAKTAEEALKNAEELIREEEEQKRRLEKKKTKNKRKRTKNRKRKQANKIKTSSEHNETATPDLSKEKEENLIQTNSLPQPPSPPSPSPHHRSPVPNSIFTGGEDDIDLKYLGSELEKDTAGLLEGLPPEIRARGEEFVEEYWRACSEGSQPIKFFRLMIVGPEGVGKTSLLKALKSQPFEEKEASTDFIEKTDITITELSKDWSQNSSFKDQLEATRDDVVAQITIQNFKSTDNELIPFESNTDHSTENDNEIIEVQYIESSTSQSDPIKSSIESEIEELFTTEVVPTQSIYTESVPEEIASPETNVHLKLKGNVLKYVQEHWDNSRSIDPKEFFTVWDLAGQSYLFCMHSMFLSPKAVYLIPIDLSVSLDDQVHQRERRLGRLERREMRHKTYLDIVLYWIQTIYSVARSAENEKCNARIILVFTKSDLIDNPQETANNYFKRIRDTLSLKSNCMSIVDTEFQIVSAKERNDNFELLKQSIQNNADLACFDFPLPIRWLDFALVILSQPNSVIGEEEINNIAAETGCLEDYVNILQLFHSIGIFFFRENIVLNSLHKLLDIILCIVAPSYCLDFKEFPLELKKHVEKAETEALLTENLLNFVLATYDLIDVKKEIVQLLEEYSVILYRHGEPKHYYIPFLFTGELSSIYSPKSNDLILYLYFPDDQIPTSFYFTLLSICIRKICCDKNPESTPIFAFDCLSFKWEDNITAIIDFTEKQSFIRIILQDIDFIQSSPDILSLIFQLQDWILCIQRDLILSWKIAEIVLDCPCASFPKTLIPCVFYKTFQSCLDDEINLYCKHEQKYYPWSFFNRQINPFVNIPPELGQRFLERHYDDVIHMLDVEPNLKAANGNGLINYNELIQVKLMEKMDKAMFFVKQIPCKGKAWANKFFEVLKSNDEVNCEVRTLFKSFIIESLHTETPLDKDRGFTRYPILNAPYGICLIINIKKFDSLDTFERRGSDVDVRTLIRTFESMNFLIHLHQDLIRSEFLHVLKNISCMDHKNFDTFFCIIMSHGNENEIYPKDVVLKDPINIDDILNLFTSNNCPTLAGKPKVFVIQACRGGLEDKVHSTPDNLDSVSTEDPLDLELKSKEDASPFTEDKRRIAAQADFYIAQATVKGHVAYRNPTEGSHFINICCSVLKAQRFNHHLGDIMMEVRRQVLNLAVGDNLLCSEGIDRLTKKLFLF